MKAESTQKSFNFGVGIEGPKSNMIPMLICNARTFGVEFNMNTIAACRKREKFFGRGNGRREGIFSVMNTFRTSECTGRILSYRSVSEKN